MAKTEQIAPIRVPRRPGDTTLGLRPSYLSTLKDAPRAERRSALFDLYAKFITRLPWIQDRPWLAAQIALFFVEPERVDPQDAEAETKANEALWTRLYRERKKTGRDDIPLPPRRGINE